MHATHDDAFWDDLAARSWRRVKWRRTDPTPTNERCVVFGTPLHRPGTYYLRPAYTDGERWLSQRGWEALQRWSGGSLSRKYARRGEGEREKGGGEVGAG